MRYWVAGLLAVALIALVGHCRAAVFDATTEGTVLVIGEILDGDFQRFKSAVASQGKTAVVITTGPGGLMLEALSIGEYIRDNKIKTIAYGDCFSGCAYIWAAGHRLGMFKNARIGFHGAVDVDTGKTSDAGNAVLGKYLSDCGMNYNFIISALAGGQDFRVINFSMIDFMQNTFKLYIFPISNESEANFFLEVAP